MIYFERIKEYVPFAKTGNAVYFGFVKENQLFGQVVGGKSAYACKVVCSKLEAISYRKSFIKLAPARFVPILAELGYPKAEYLFALENMDSLPKTFDQVLNVKVCEEISTSKLEKANSPKR